MRVILAGVLAAAAATSASLSAADPPQRWSRAIEFAPQMAEGPVSAALDADVYAATQPDLSDLRVLDAEDREVGFIVRTRSTATTRDVDRFWTPRGVTLKPLDEGGLEVILALDENAPQPDGIRVVTPLDDFEQRVRVSVSDDGANWAPVAEALLFDYSRYMDVRNDRIPLPKTSQRRFRVVIDQVTAAQESELLELTRRLQGGDESERTERVRIQRRPFRIDRVELWRRETERQSLVPQLVSYAPQRFETTDGVDDPQSRTTQVVIDMQREPVSEFSIETSDRNFSRAARVEVEQTVGRTQRWNVLASGLLTRFQLPNLTRDEMAIQFPVTRGTRYRLTIENRDSPPLEVTGVEARGVVHEVVFLANPGGEYRLAYGGDLPPPSYDTAALTSVLAAGAMSTAATLADEPQPLGAAPQAGTLQRWFNDPWLLTGIIVVLAAALGWALYQAAQRIDGSPLQGPPGETGAAE
jgi:hypothetical protein